MRQTRQRRRKACPVRGRRAARLAVRPLAGCASAGRDSYCGQLTAGNPPVGAAQPGSPGSTWRLLRPSWAKPTYGKVSWYALSFVLTPSPSRLFGKPLNGAPASRPTVTRNEISTTSSETRRPTLGTPHPPVRAQLLEQPRRKHHVAVPLPFALIDPKHHPLAVDVGDLQMRGLGDTQSRRIGRHQDGPMLHAVDGFEEAQGRTGKRKAIGTPK